MRKKLIAVFIIFTLVLLHVSALEFIMTPWQGGFGLPMDSKNYDFPSGTSEITYDVNFSSNSTGERTIYTDKEIVGIVGVHNIDTHNGIFDSAESEYDPEGMTITARCEGGFYFTSRSNPDAKRPFEIKLVLKRSSRAAFLPGIFNRDDYDDEGYFTLGENNDESIDSYSFPGVNASWGIYRYRNIWCDLVICLPAGEVSSTGVLTIDNRQYNLIEADDYSAVVTIDIEFDGKTESLTIPLSGYYSRNPNSSENMETASLDVRTLPAAMNLNIGGTRERKRVANLDFMVNRTKYSVDEVYDWLGRLDYELNTSRINDFDYKIFLSASNDSKHSEDRGFELVHSSVNYTDPHTPYNSIGYTARLVNDDTGEYMDFNGTDKIVNGVVPGLSADKGDKTNQGHTIYYSEFHGGVEVLIDEITANGDQEGINKMLSGQYTSTIYVHVVGQE